MPSSVEMTAEQRIVEAAATLTDDLCAVTGWAGLRWLGGLYFDGLRSGGREVRPVTLAVGTRNQRPQKGISISKDRLIPSMVEEFEGVRVTLPVVSTSYEMRFARTLVRAVVALDMACLSDFVSLIEARKHIGALGPATGVVQAREALTLADENSWSPMETVIRVAWILGLRLHPPLTNRPLFDLSGHHIGTPDLLDPSLGLVLEYDGRLHLAGEQKVKDLDRLEALRDHGLEVQVIVAEHVFPMTRLVERLAAARSRALRSVRTQAWTLDLPPWWQPDHTVEQRRALASSSRLALPG